MVKVVTTIHLEGNILKMAGDRGFVPKDRQCHNKYMASRMITCSMTSRVRSSYSVLSLHFHTDNIAWNYTKTANIIEKTSVYHTVNGNRALFHTSKTAKMIKVMLLSSTLTF